MWRTAETISTSGTARVILAIETSCDDTCAAVIDDGGRIRANVISSQGIHDRYGGVVPEIASRHHLELIGDAVDDALGAGREWRCRTSGWWRSPAAPGWWRRCWSGWPRAKALAAAFALPLAPVDHLHGHIAASFLGDAGRVCSRRSSAWWPAAGTPSSPGCATGGPDYQVLGQTLDDAAGEAFDKGARLLGLGYPGGAALERLARDGDPGGVRVPHRGPPARPGLLVRRAQDIAALPRSRARARPRPSAGAPTWPPPTSGRSSRRWRCGPSGRWCRPGLTGWRSAAGWRPTGRCASGSPGSGCELDIPAARAVHRQRGDDRQRRPLRACVAVSATISISTSTPPASGRPCTMSPERGPLQPARAAACATTPARCCCASARASAFRVRGARHRSRRLVAARISRADPSRYDRRRGGVRVLRRRSRAEPAAQLE